MVAALFCISTTAHAQALPGQSTGFDRLFKNQTLWASGQGRMGGGCSAWIAYNTGQSQYILSRNKDAQFFAQTDGNLVVYEGTRAQWALFPKPYSPPEGAIILGRGLVMQCDGNLVYYLLFNFRLDDPRSSITANYAHVYWSSRTWGHPGAFLVIQNDGNLVIYDKDQVTPLWWVFMPDSGFQYVG
jgi:hypothetical protein